MNKRFKKGRERKDRKTYYHGTALKEDFDKLFEILHNPASKIEVYDAVPKENLDRFLSE